MAGTRRSTRGARQSYREDSTDSEHNASDFESGGSHHGRRSAKANMRSRRSKPKPLREESSSSDTPDSDFIAVEPPRKKARKTRQPTADNASSSTPRRRRGRLSKSQKEEPAKPQRVIESDGKVPRWETLPYEIVLRVFQYALGGLHQDHSNASPLVSWAIKMSCTCKSFTEPALTALYECPPIFAGADVFGLLDLLRSTESQTIDYRIKIKRLRLDAKPVLAYKVSGRGQVSITDLLMQLPQLQDFDILGSTNRPPFWAPTKRGIWHYPQNLFSTMNDAGVRLKSLHLNGDLISPPTVHDLVDEGFSQPCIKYTNRLMLSNMVLDRPLTSPKGTASFHAPALKHLENLRNLAIESCTVGENWSLFESLPNKLHNLTVIHCPDFDSSVLMPLLMEHGHEMRSLILAHNNALDLSFLPDLRARCPKLEVLRYDATYYNDALLYKSDNALPKYDTLLDPDTAPTWPTSLRVVEMLNLQQWSSESAVTLFQSLCDSANELSYLRTLVIRAMLNIGWRDRAGFREKWIDKLNRTFLQNDKQPSLHLSSLKEFRLWTQANMPTHETGSPARRKTSNAERRSTRSTRQEADADADEEDEPVQGLCDRVEISIDNMRPSEQQFNENDFMDSEISGDEDWTGANEEPSSPRYAW